MHSTRARDQEIIRDLATEGKWEQAYRRSVLWDFAHEARMGFQLAFLRPFAVPRMARVLVGTGHILAAPEQRSYNTGILIHEIISGGLASLRSRQAVAHINRAHRAPGVIQEDLSYVLAAFIVVPTRHIERVGWRPLLDEERQAALQFYRGLGRLMNIRELPTSYESAADLLDSYEAEHIAASSAGQQIGADIIAVLRRRLPRPLRPLAGSVFASQLHDDRILAALGIGGGPLPARVTIDGVLRTVAAVRAQSPAPTAPSFTPGQPAGRIYPRGYNLDDITAP